MSEKKSSVGQNLFSPKHMEQMWQDPPALYRSAPFWSWNGWLDKKRLCLQIQSMYEAGMGGFFMHSRYGLKTEYLGKEWFDCVSACIDKAEQLKMKAYLYDEDRWPSGYAGGIVASEHKEFRMCCLAAVKAEKWEQSPDKQLVGIFSIELDENGLMKSYRRLSENKSVEKDSNKLIFYVRYELPSERYNNSTYIDTMNHRAVAQFIKSTYEEYAKRYPRLFGSVVPAIFTDEPNYGNRYSGQVNDEYLTPWTADLLDEFKKRCGYDIGVHLPELIFISVNESFSKARYDYYRTISELFVQSYSKQTGEWCEKNNIKLTGHMLFEETCFKQTRAGGFCMPHYVYMQWPGIDILTDQADELLTAKQCSSIAAQFSKERVLTELWGCTGWDWPLEGHKFISDWQFAAGINFLCPHLTQYTLAGGGKRDYPASIRDHSPWWPYYKPVQDYFARTSLMLTGGRPVRDILVIHPIESMWGLYNAAKPKVSEYIDNDLKSISYALTGSHSDWDFGDESVMADSAHIDGRHLCVGQMRYKLVIVPSAATLRSGTVALLEKFLSREGQVLFVGSTPNRIDGIIDEQVSALANRARHCEVGVFLSAVESLLDRQLSITENNRQQEKIWSMLQDIGVGKLLFIQSHDRRAAHNVNICVWDAAKPVVLWDALSGQKRLIESQSINGKVSFNLKVPPTGSAIITFGIEVERIKEKPADFTVVNTQEIKGPFKIELTEPNTCPLDYCRFKFSDEEFSELMPLLAAEQFIRARFGLEPRSNSKQQPWYLIKAGLTDEIPRGSVQMLYSFHITGTPKQCLLALEEPQSFQIKVNGANAGKADGWWLDEGFQTIDIARLLKKGDNTILLEFDYCTGMELEGMYLVGSFGIAVRDKDEAIAPDNFTLIEQPKSLKLGPWTGQGLDFYGGSVKYKISVTRPKEGQRLVIKLPCISCTMAVIHIGGKSFVLPWPPFSADITDFLVDGYNEVIIEIVGGRRNILGPLHLQPKAWTGPEQFDPHHPDWTFEYHLSQHGIMAPIIVETLRCTK